MSSAVSAADSGETRSLSLADCLQIALEHNLDVKIDRYGPEIARYNLTVAYATYDPVFDITGMHNYTQQPGGIDAQNRPFPGTSTHRDSFNAGLAGVLPTGLSYDLSGDVGDTSGENPQLANPLNPSGYFENTSGNVSIRMRQPLLKNFWIDSPRLNIRVGKKQVEISELTLQQRVMNTVASIEVAYYELISAQESVKVQQQALTLAERLLLENKKRVEVGAMAPLDEKDAERQVATSRANLISVQNLLSTRQNALKSLLSDDYSEWHSVKIQPAETLSALPQTFDVQDSWQKGLTKRPEVLQAKVDLERKGLVLKFQRNQLYPQLDVIGSYGRAGSKSDYTGFFKDLWEDAGPFWSVGGVLQVPLGNRVARSNYRASQAEQEQLVLRLKKLEQSVMVQIDDAVKQAQSSLERVDATRSAREFAEKALEAEQKKLENGKSTSYFVLRLQNDLTLAQFNEISALADYNRALAQLSLSEGTSLERHRLTLDVR